MEASWNVSKERSVDTHLKEPAPKKPQSSLRFMVLEALTSQLDTVKVKNSSSGTNRAGNPHSLKEKHCSYKATVQCTRNKEAKYNHFGWYHLA